MRESSVKEQIFHKEESEARNESDQADKLKIRLKLENIIHPLKPESHDNQLLNIASGYICQNQSVNVDNTVENRGGGGNGTGIFRKSSRRILLHNS